MKCPKCGSEHIQYATKTSGGGFSAGNSCCGYILLGPLGLLCGACGSGTRTDEFWICQDCGTKFSNWTAQHQQSQENNARIKREEDHAKYLRYTEELAAIQSIEGDYQTIRTRSQEMKQRKDDAQKKEDDFLKEAQKSTDPTISKLANAGKWTIRSAGISFLVSLLSLFFFENIEVATLLFIVALGLIFAWSSKTDTARKELMEYSQEFFVIATETDTTKEETERLKNLVEKIDFVERYRT